MSGLSKYQLERADLLTTIEQGRRVETELFAENSRSLQTMGELLKARLFGSTQWAIDLRDRMLKFQGGRDQSAQAVRGRPGAGSLPAIPGRGLPEPHPDLDAEDI